MAVKLLLLTVLALTLGSGMAAPASAQDTTKPPKEKKVKDSSKVKAPKDTSKVKEMPTDAQLEERKKEAEALPLFTSAEPLEFTLIANYKALAKNRDTLSTRRFAAQLILAGASDTIPMQLRTRGHYRLAKCSFVPLRLEFTKKETKGTPFEGQKSLKLGTHCQRDDLFEQYVLREYQVYRLHGIITPLSFRARLAHITYLDSATLKPVDRARWAMIVESEEHMGARNGGVVREMRRALFEDVEQEPLITMSVFQFMVGNVDWSMYALHNVRMVTTPNGRLLPVPYDFDFTGLVNTTYARPDPQIPIKSVRERLYRGPCTTAAALEPILANFRSKKAHILAVYDSLPPLDQRYARDSKEYLEDFFRTLDRPRDIKAELIENCNRKGGT
ncbi:MAG: hypothetical protein ABI877_04790 [Gemmatimonadaceae bacterium]